MDRGAVSTAAACRVNLSGVRRRSARPRFDRLADVFFRISAIVHHRDSIASVGSHFYFFLPSSLSPSQTAEWREGVKARRGVIPFPRRFVLAAAALRVYDGFRMTLGAPRAGRKRVFHTALLIGVASASSEAILRANSVPQPIRIRSQSGSAANQVATSADKNTEELIMKRKARTS